MSKQQKPSLFCYITGLIGLYIAMFYINYRAFFTDLDVLLWMKIVTIALVVLADCDFIVVNLILIWSALDDDDIDADNDN